MENIVTQTKNVLTLKEKFNLRNYIVEYSNPDDLKTLLGVSSNFRLNEEVKIINKLIKTALGNLADHFPKFYGLLVRELKCLRDFVEEMKIKDEFKNFIHNLKPEEQDQKIDLLKKFILKFMIMKVLDSVDLAKTFFYYSDSNAIKAYLFEQSSLAPVNVANYKVFTHNNAERVERDFLIRLSEISNSEENYKLNFPSKFFNINEKKISIDENSSPEEKELLKYFLVRSSYFDNLNLEIYDDKIHIHTFRNEKFYFFEEEESITKFEFVEIKNYEKFFCKLIDNLNFGKLSISYGMETNVNREEFLNIFKLLKVKYLGLKNLNVCPAEVQEKIIDFISSSKTISQFSINPNFFRNHQLKYRFSERKIFEFLDLGIIKKETILMILEKINLENIKGLSFWGCDINLEILNFIFKISPKCLFLDDVTFDEDCLSFDFNSVSHKLNFVRCNNLLFPNNKIESFVNFICNKQENKSSFEFKYQYGSFLNYKYDESRKTVFDFVRINFKAEVFSITFNAYADFAIKYYENSRGKIKMNLEFDTLDEYITKVIREQTCQKIVVKVDNSVRLESVLDILYENDQIKIVNVFYYDKMLSNRTNPGEREKQDKENANLVYEKFRVKSEEIKLLINFN